MQLKALTKSGTEMTDGRCQSDRMTGLRGGRELTTTQVAKLVSTGWSALSDLRREVPAKVNSYHGGRLCCSKNVGAQFIGLASLSLRGARFLAYARNRLRNLGGEPNEIVTPRQVGARNDKRAWCWMKKAATISWRRDRHLQVSSFYFGDGRESMTRFILLPSLSRCRVIIGQNGADGEDHYRCPCGALGNEGTGRSWVMNNTSNVCGVE